MSKLAFDIVLSLPTDIANFCIELNQNLEHIRLHPTDCVPHISLAMGVADEDDLPDLDDLKLEPFEVEFRAVESVEVRPGDWMGYLQLKVTPPLQTLHENAMELAAPHTSIEPDESMFFKAEPNTEITDGTRKWVKEYATASAYQHFDPHVTLGMGKLPESTAPDGFIARQVALYQLGNHCTCRRVLKSIELS